MGKQRRILLLAAVLFVIGSALLYQALPHDSAERQFDVPDTSIMPSRYDTGEISIDASGQNVYLSNKYGFRLTYPQGWRVGDNHLGYGALQFFNYAASDSYASSKGFARGENKIEATIVGSSAVLFPDSSDYPTKKVEKVSLNLEKGVVPGTNVELIGGEKYRVYLLQFPNISDQFLAIGIFGDPSNFYVLDDLVKSIVWK